MNNSNKYFVSDKFYFVSHLLTNSRKFLLFLNNFLIFCIFMGAEAIEKTNETNYRWIRNPKRVRHKKLNSANNRYGPPKVLI